jgi:hypothetical protein
MKKHTGKSAGTNRCPKCTGEMVQGFIVGREGPNRVVSTWVDGSPQAVGTLFRQVKAPRDRCVPVGTFRCSACGFLESYARPDFAAK